MALKRLRRAAGKSGAEPLAPDDWMVLWALEHTRANRAMHGLWRALPTDPRCRMCAAPFAGIGRAVTRPLGYRPSRKNPNYCATCVELSPPGGVTMPTGVLFADVRGFTRESEHAAPEEVSRRLRRFYGAAEEALFPEAIIDKLIGDEVMALYLGPLFDDEAIPALMLRHARSLLAAVGYGTDEGPFLHLGIGIDYGDAFVGNIGQRDVYDFTAVGDVVNTASRLQSAAGPGEIVIADRASSGLDLAGAEVVELDLKGKEQPVVAHRFAVA